MPVGVEKCVTTARELQENNETAVDLYLKSAIEGVVIKWVTQINGRLKRMFIYDVISWWEGIGKYYPYFTLLDSTNNLDVIDINFHFHFSHEQLKTFIHFFPDVFMENSGCAFNNGGNPVPSSGEWKTTEIQFHNFSFISFNFFVKIIICLESDYCLTFEVNFPRKLLI